MARLLILPALWHVMACPRQRMAATEQTQYMRGPSSFRRPLVFLLSNTSHLSTTYLCFNHFTHHPISLYLSDCTCRLSNQKLLSLSLSISLLRPCFADTLCGRMLVRIRKTQAWGAIGPYMFPTCHAYLRLSRSDTRLFRTAVSTWHVEMHLTCKTTATRPENNESLRDSISPQSLPGHTATREAVRGPLWRKMTEHTMRKLRIAYSESAQPLNAMDTRASVVYL